MKPLLICILLLLSGTNVLSQYRPLHNFVYFKGGVRFSSFLFNDRENESNLVNFYHRNAFSLIVSYALTADEQKHQVLPEIAFYQSGAKARYAGNQAEWALNYIGLGGSYLYKIIDRQQLYKFGLLIGGNVGLDYLLSGWQSVNYMAIDVKSSDAFTAFNFRGGPVVMGKYLINPRVQATLEYRFDISINNIEKQDAATQSTRNMGHSYLFGLAVKL
jgi:hypothetical protein